MPTGNITDPLSLNYYTYSANNPVMYCDPSGNVWETIFDIVSLGASFIEALEDPTDGWLWVGVAADAVDLIPFVTGVGEVARAIRIADNVADTVDNIHDTKKIADVADNVIDGIKIQKATEFTPKAKETIDNLPKVNGYTKSNKSDGVKIHSGYKTGYDDSLMHKEYSYEYSNKKIRLDFYDEDNNIIYELKPNNPKAIKAGIKQLKNYNKIIGKNSTLILEVY